MATSGYEMLAVAILCAAILGALVAIYNKLLTIERRLEIETMLDSERNMDTMATSKELLELSRSIVSKAQADHDATHALVGALNDTKALYDKAIADLEAANTAGVQADIDEAFANLQSVSGMIEAEAVVKAAVAGTPSVPTE